MLELLVRYSLLVRIGYLLERLVRGGKPPSSHLPSHRPQLHLVPLSQFHLIYFRFPTQKISHHYFANHLVNQFHVKRELRMMRRWLIDYLN